MPYGKTTGQGQGGRGMHIAQYIGDLIILNSVMVSWLIGKLPIKLNNSILAGQGLKPPISIFTFEVFLPRFAYIPT